METFLRVFETAKIAVHWDHLLAPTEPSSGANQEISWKGTAKRIAGLVILAFSSVLIGAVPTMILFSIAIPYYTYTAYEKTHVSSSDEETPPVKQPLSEEEVDKLNQLGMDAILKAAAEGKKVGLIIGRDKDQPMPIEEGWLWVAGNIYGDPAVLKNRVDLQMDFVEDRTIQRLKGIFDRVVVDFSTFKFMEGWAFLYPLLKPTPESQLITETSKGMMGVLFNIERTQIDCVRGTVSYPFSHLQKEDEENERLFQEWKDQVGEREFEQTKKEFLEAMSASERETYTSFGDEQELDLAFFYHILDKHYPNRYIAGREATREGIAKFRHYLKSLFNRVEIYDNTAPYPTRKGCHTEKAAHFVLTGPAKQSQERAKVFEMPS